jgi:hypothetical protein
VSETPNEQTGMMRLVSQMTDAEFGEFCRALRETERERLTAPCSQCGQDFAAPACGFSHATIQAER